VLHLLVDGLVALGVDVGVRVPDVGGAVGPVRGALGPEVMATGFRALLLLDVLAPAGLALADAVGVVGRAVTDLVRRDRTQRLTRLGVDVLAAGADGLADLGLALAHRVLEHPLDALGAGPGGLPRV